MDRASAKRKAGTFAEPRGKGPRGMNSGAKPCHERPGPTKRGESKARAKVGASTASGVQALRGTTFLVTSMTREPRPQLMRGRMTAATTRWARTWIQFLPSPPPLYSGAV